MAFEAPLTSDWARPTAESNKEGTNSDRPPVPRDSIHNVGAANLGRAIRSASVGDEQRSGALSDVPFGDRWWIASDGKWYPPEAHPDAGFEESRPSVDTPGPASGSWQASDGNWYAAELHPDNIEDAGAARPGRSAVTRHAGASAPGGLSLPAPRSSAGKKDSSYTNGSGPPPPPDLDFDPMLDPDTLFGGLAGSADSPPPASFQSQERSGNPLTAPVPPSPPAIPLPVAHFFAEPSTDASLTTDPGRSMPTSGSDGHGAPQPAPAGDARRPVNPGFGKVNAPPPGSTVHEELPRGSARPHGPPGQIPRPDGFDELLQSIMPATPPAPRHTPASPPQRLMGVSDVLSGARTTAGGPASAVPRVSTRESDFFVMKPSNKKTKQARTEPRTKLSGFLFVLVLLLVLAAVAAAIFYIHR
jgi:hypothetical protein